MISPDILQQLYGKWQELLNREEGEALKKIICIDGKTMRSNKRGNTKPSYIVTAWSREDGFGLGQKTVDEKSNEITAIPELLENLQVKGQIITIDAMGTQTVIAEKIRGKKADYVLALKGNQGSKKKTKEKAHGQIEIREYYQTEDVVWLERKKDWKGLKSIAMERKSIESMHWHLDVTFREDANATLDKMSAQNLNIIRKWSLSILKMMELTKTKLSMKKKRFVISLAPIKYLEEVLEF